MSRPRVHVGIVAYNSASDLPACLASITKQVFPSITVTVFDNCSSDDSLAIVERYYPSAHVIVSSENVGFGQGHNAIVRSIRFGNDDYYLMLNPDASMMPNYISELVGRMKTAGCSWSVGKLISHKVKNKAILYSVGHALLKNGYAFNIGHGLADIGQYDKPREIFGAPAAASLWSYRALRKLNVRGNVFDPDMFMYNEDVDLDWRARLHGLSCWYEPGAIAFHRQRMLTNTLSLHAIRNRYVSVLKNTRPTTLASYNIPLIMAHCAYKTLLKPSDGLWLTRQLLSAIPKVVRTKASAKNRYEMEEWFRWSAMQKTGQPVTIHQRLLAHHRNQS